MCVRTKPNTTRHQQHDTQRKQLHLIPQPRVLLAAGCGAEEALLPEAVLPKGQRLAHADDPCGDLFDVVVEERPTLVGRQVAKVLVLRRTTRRQRTVMGEGHAAAEGRRLRGQGKKEGLRMGGTVYVRA